MFDVFSETPVAGAGKHANICSYHVDEHHLKNDGCSVDTIQGRPHQSQQQQQQQQQQRKQLAADVNAGNDEATQAWGNSEAA